MVLFIVKFLMEPLHKVAEIRVAAECCILSANKILLQKRPNDSKNFPGFWTFPGGHIDQGEDSLNAIIREVKEETGIEITHKNTKLKVNALNYHVDKKQIWVIFGFMARLESLQENISTDEGETKWFKVSELTSLDLFPPIKHYLEFILSDKPGVLFMSAEWKNSSLKKLLSEKIDSSN